MCKGMRGEGKEEALEEEQERKEEGVGCAKDGR